MNTLLLSIALPLSLSSVDRPASHQGFIAHVSTLEVAFDSQESDSQTQFILPNGERQPIRSWHSARTTLRTQPGVSVTNASLTVRSTVEPPTTPANYRGKVRITTRFFARYTGSRTAMIDLELNPLRVLHHSSEWQDLGVISAVRTFGTNPEHPVVKRRIPPEVQARFDAGWRVVKRPRVTIEAGKLEFYSEIVSVERVFDSVPDTLLPRRRTAPPRVVD